MKPRDNYMDKNHHDRSTAPDKAVSNGATGTNTQEAEVDEPDVAKTDGRIVVRLQDGRALVVKTGILFVALAAGWLLRARLRRRAAVELVLVAALVAAVSVLVTLRPGRNVVAVQRAAGVSPAALTCSS